MDIITHTLSGIAVATGVVGLSGKPWNKKILVICCGAVGALLPDMDAVTRWPGFDATIGRWLDLPQSGRAIYFANFWYSHHNFCHSLAAGVLFTLLLGIVVHRVQKLSVGKRGRPTFLKSSWIYLSVFFLGFCMHLLGDIPTPDSTWKGIKLFWPLATPVGGSGHIWWWNNYDIFILLLAGCGINSIIIFLNSRFKHRILSFMPILLCIFVFGVAVFQITHRPIRFAGPGSASTHAEKERQSLAIQKEILGKALYHYMVAMDRHVPIPF
jgi:inner membrane protein